MLAATAARVTEKTDDSDSETDEDKLEQWTAHAGSMKIIDDTLKGIAANDGDEGRLALGRHATTIRLGRDLWESPPLTLQERRQARQAIFDESTFPDPKESLDAADKAVQLDQARKEPYKARTQPYAKLTKTEYGFGFARGFTM